MVGRRVSHMCGRAHVRVRLCGTGHPVPVLEQGLRSASEENTSWGELPWQRTV